MAWVRTRVKIKELSERSVLEVGSQDVNGSVRQYFKGPYVGIDGTRSKGVDIQALSWSLPFADDTFDVVVSTEMLEHDLYPWRTMAEITRVVRPGGDVLLTARGYDGRGCFGIHGYPQDYWRFSLGGLRALCESCGLGIIRAKEDPDHPGVFIHARL
jgi:SAM-dependent methyltransferase